MSNENLLSEHSLLDEIHENAEVLIEKMRQEVTEPLPLPVLPTPATLPSVLPTSAALSTPLVLPVKKVSFWDLLRGEKHFLWTVVLVISWLIVTSFLVFLYTNPQSGQTVFSLGQVEILGPTDLCPGESLRFRVNVAVAENGVYRLAMSTWKTFPLPATYVFSQGLDMVMAERREFPIEIEWVVPETYDSLATGKMAKWPSGDYSRDIAVTATGRNTSTSTEQVPFTIRDDCIVSRH